jgi:hypothetical protein
MQTEDLVRSFNMEVKMLQKGYIPDSVEEHLKVSLRTGGCPILSCACFVGMDDIATKDFFDWISSVPKMVRALSIILRLADDLHSYEVFSFYILFLNSLSLIWTCYLPLK